MLRLLGLITLILGSFSVAHADVFPISGDGESAQTLYRLVSALSPAQCTSGTCTTTLSGLACANMSMGGGQSARLCTYTLVPNGDVKTLADDPAMSLMKAYVVFGKAAEICPDVDSCAIVADSTSCTMTSTATEHDYHCDVKYEK